MRAQVEVDGDVRAHNFDLPFSRALKARFMNEVRTKAKGSTSFTSGGSYHLDANGVHRFGEPLEISFWMKYPVLSIERMLFVSNTQSAQQPVIHAWALYPEVRLGIGQGEISSCL